MGLLALVKGMKIEDNRPFKIVFRTSRSSLILGTILVFTSIILLLQVAFKNPIFCYLCFILGITVTISGVLLILGLLISSYRKCVVIDMLQSCIEINETGLFCSRRLKLHFKDILYLELGRVGQCLFAQHNCFWTVKVYFKRVDQLETIKVFESTSKILAEEASYLLSHVLNKNIIKEDTAFSYRTNWEISNTVKEVIRY